MELWGKLVLVIDNHRDLYIFVYSWTYQLTSAYIVLHHNTGMSYRFFLEKMIRLWLPNNSCITHYDDVIMTMLASQITSLTVVYSIVYSGVNQRKHQSSASLAFVREIHRGPVNFPHKWPVTRKMFPFDDVIIKSSSQLITWNIFLPRWYINDSHYIIKI